MIIGVDKKRISVRRGFRGPAGTDIAAGAAEILDVELLAEMIRQFLRHQAAEYIDRSARSEWHDHADLP